MTGGDGGFQPSDGAGPAGHDFTATLVVAESAMTIEPTAMDDVAKLARLPHDGGRAGGGRAGGERLLSPALPAQAIDPRRPMGLATGLATVDGPVRYHLAFWPHPYRATSGELFHPPTMSGYGGNRVLCCPTA